MHRGRASQRRRASPEAAGSRHTLRPARPYGIAMGTADRANRAADASYRGRAAPELAAAMIAQKAIDAGLHKSEDLDAFAARAGFAGVTEIPIEAAMRELAAGVRSLAELDTAGLVRVVERQLPPASRRLIDELAPERIRLPGGRH